MPLPTAPGSLFSMSALVSLLAADPQGGNWVAGLAFALGIPVVLSGYLFLAKLSAERRWRAAAEHLDLEFTGGKTRSLRGELRGRRVDAVWARRTGRSRGYESGSSSIQSGVRFTVRHADLQRGLSVRGSEGLARMLARPEHAATIRESDVRVLERLFARLPEAEVDDTGVRLGRAQDNLSAAQMTAAIEAMVEASLELAPGAAPPLR